MSKMSQPRVAALVGPYGSGKTSLLESLLFACGAIHRNGRVTDGSAVGDSSPEARARSMSVESTVASATYLGDSWTFVDCPGSPEFQQDAFHTLMVADAAVVVVEPDPSRAVMVAPLLQFLDEHKVPHLLFISKTDTAQVRLSETIEALQAVSERPLILREMPLRDGDKITGFVDLVSERAYKYRPGQPSDLVPLPGSKKDEEAAARQDMLEHLADLDDHLLEELLEDVAPPTGEVYDNLSRDLALDLIVPVFFGAATEGHGVRRLLKALRHEAPEPAVTAKRLGIAGEGAPLAQIFKTVHAAHTGKLSYGRIWRGEFVDGATVAGSRIGGLYTLTGGQPAKASRAGSGEVVAFGRLDPVQTGQVIGADDGLAWPAALPPLFALTVEAEKKADEVKLTGALAKLVEEDPSLSLEQDPDHGQILLWGQGEVHLQVAADKLKNRFGLAVVTSRPQVAYRETIRKSAADVHGRHKKQSGGHGQFGDVIIDIAPQPRGAGFAFHDKVVGGAIPRNYIPSVEEGARDCLRHGPLGFQVVDVAVTLTGGSYHTVDSSDMAFKAAVRLALNDGLAQCDPVLLEPIVQVEIAVPSEFTSKAQRIISGRRGQILGYDSKPGWKGWDVVTAYLPQAEMHDLIVELRSLTMGVGTFAWKFDHLQEVTGKTADKVVADKKAAS